MRIYHFAFLGVLFFFSISCGGAGSGRDVPPPQGDLDAIVQAMVADVEKIAEALRNFNNCQEFQQALRQAQAENLDLFVLGDGANVLISNEGFDGLIIQPNFTKLWHKNIDAHNVVVHAGTGILMPHLIN